ncbi:hypothetical protein SDRG_09282 [Saprolegnia diclina VS20]|uniref:Lipoyl-binding domain-containing protein n=1 Tax=Saprolegnia diclina (strain VS20) TaxID=1156394 RepID=T0RSU1_SAPDV|nr:hypothetical protein SDRG_09282 [Saprolegnia diclina VS20]EQC33302.1 hypothetical protein SDRG_09282 [Saprolegnia diclina VS20]|eukprot:XP_008613425.1 hypothetical protein SDRG_09282 [Saprolegnia diclina VS20]
MLRRVPNLPGVLRHFAGPRWTRAYITTIDIPIPSMGPSIHHGLVLKWAKQVGDAVAADDVVAVFETDKVTIDLRSPQAGVIAKHLVETNVRVPIGSPLFRLTQGLPHTTSPEALAACLTVPVPHLGETVANATIVEWVKYEGDRVLADDVVLVLETDKVSVDVCAPVAGVIRRGLANVNDVVHVGGPLFVLAPEVSTKDGSDAAA